MNVLTLRVHTLCLAVSAALAPLPVLAAETVIIRDAQVDLIQPSTYDHAEVYDSIVSNGESRTGSAVSIDRGNLWMERTRVLSTGDGMSALSYYGGEYRNNGVTYDAVIEGSDFTTRGERAFGLLFGSTTFDSRTGMLDRVGRITVRDSSVSTAGSEAHGMAVAGVNTVDFIGSRVATSGRGAHGAAMMGGTLALQDSTVETRGDGAHGVYARSMRWSITGHPPFAYRADLTLVDSSISTHGVGSVGILAGYQDGGVAEGIGADVRLDNAHVRSSQGHAVQFLRGKENTLRLARGSIIDGGDAVLLAGQADSVARVLAADSLLVGRGAQALVADQGAELQLDLARSEVRVGLGQGLAHARQDSRIAIRAVGSRLAGHVQVDADATLSVDLDGSDWNARGDSRLDQLGLRNRSTLVLGAGSVGDRMIVRGDLAIDDSTLVFDSALGDETSLTDHLWVQGSTAGHGAIRVNNLGGRGGRTEDGIQLIQVDGVSAATFQLAGRAVGGRYEYFLFQGSSSDPANGHWYLRSALQPEVVDPCAADPAAPGCGAPTPDPEPETPAEPRPVLRPEAGSYLANQRAALQMFGLQAQERHAAGAGDGLGGWAVVAGSTARHGAVADQLRVRGETTSLHIGTDLLAWGQDTRGAVGVLLGSGKANSTSRSRLTGYRAGGKVDGKVVGVYGQWRQRADGDRGLYVDGTLQHARFGNSVQGDGLDTERYDSRSTSAAVEAGYAFTLLHSARRAVYVQPQAQLRYSRFDADAHTERNGTLIDGAGADGLGGRAGVRVFGHANATGGTRVQPYLAANWIRESHRHGLRLDGERVTGGVPRDRHEIAAGVQVHLGARWRAWGDLGWQRGNGGYRQANAALGLRRTW